MKYTKVLFFLICFLFSLINNGCSKNYIAVKIEGTGMLPNFNNSDRVIIEKDVKNINRGDVVLFYNPKDNSRIYFKRVIGLPNEIIELSEGRVFINNKELEEPYLSQTYNQSKSNFPQTRIPNQSYFVIGDNRDNSSDSRYFGSISEGLIIGRYYSSY